MKILLVINNYYAAGNGMSASARRTAQFALSSRSRFPEKNPEALANRIDYWLSNPELRWEEGKKYVKHMEQYDIKHSVEKLIDMFQYAIDNYNKK